jgi:allophanate hydrolase subunit 2
LPVDDAATGLPTVDQAPVPGLPDDLELRVLPGPRDDWVTAEAVRQLATASYQVSPRSNRVGVRLEGPALARSRRDELPSEGIVRGAVQVPPDGKPVLFLADHPVTGGYPVIGVVEPADTDLLGQARPGQRVSLRWVVR